MEGNWIKCTDTLPTKKDGNVLFVGYQDIMLVGAWYEYSEEGSYLETDETMLTDVTHWQPLPSPPKTE